MTTIGDQPPDDHAPVLIEHHGPVTVLTINRPEVRNAIDRTTGDALAGAFETFEADDERSVAVLTGAEGTFCSGADLSALAANRGNRLHLDISERGPLGPTRMQLDKPVIAAVEGFAVAGGLELALWCDLRVAAEDAVFGVYCRRWGVPLVDGGTIRLPRLIGHSRALDMMLTGRGVGAAEAFQMGLSNRVVEPGTALQHAITLATEIASFPQRCLRADRRSSYEQWDLTFEEALANEAAGGWDVIESGETAAGAQRFAKGAGRHGAPAPLQ